LQQKTTVARNNKDSTMEEAYKPTESKGDVLGKNSGVTIEGTQDSKTEGMSEEREREREGEREGEEGERRDKEVIQRGEEEKERDGGETTIPKNKASKQRRTTTSPPCKARYVYNAFQKQQNMASCASDDENVILALNVKTAGSSSPNSQNEHVRFPEPYNEHVGTHPFLSRLSGERHSYAFLSPPRQIQNERGFSENHDSYATLPSCSNPLSDSNKQSHLLLQQKSPHSYNQKDGSGCFESVGSSPSRDKSCMDRQLKKVRLLVEFEEKSKKDEWPLSTSVHCYWCCHPFASTPVGLPVKYSNEKFSVIGCFCSLECAASYNFNSRISVDEIWERYNLLNLLAEKLFTSNLELNERNVSVGENTPTPTSTEEHGTDMENKLHGEIACFWNQGGVKQAPDRTTLKMFGGYLNIDEFRSYNHSRKLGIVNCPPMVSLTQQIEEINDSDIHSTYRFVPIDNERVNRYKRHLVLERSKPLVTVKNTLDRTMNIRYSYTQTT
jgi:hypothetical protein